MASRTFSSRCVSQCVPLSGSKSAIALQQVGLNHLLVQHPVGSVLTAAEKAKVLIAAHAGLAVSGNGLQRPVPSSTSVELRSSLFGSERVTDAEDREVFRHLVQSWPVTSQRKRKTKAAKK